MDLARRADLLNTLDLVVDLGPHGHHDKDASGEYLGPKHQVTRTSPCPCKREEGREEERRSGVTVEMMGGMGNSPL